MCQSMVGIPMIHIKHIADENETSKFLVSILASC
jgi:hypothetical protein